MVGPTDQQVEGEVGHQLFDGSLVAGLAPVLGGEVEPVPREPHLVDRRGDCELAHAVVELLGAHRPFGVCDLELGVGRAEHPGLVVELVAQLGDRAGDQPDAVVQLPDVPGQVGAHLVSTACPVGRVVEPVPDDVDDHQHPRAIDGASETEAPDVGEVLLEEQRHVELVPGVPVADRPRLADPERYPFAGGHREVAVGGRLSSEQLDQPGPPPSLGEVLDHHVFHTTVEEVVVVQHRRVELR
ncbi:MAG TPA: hypothetical protein VFO49_11545 [Nocardioides sp.]|nr:hypothetical protein [Nocardioides sp.]